MTTVKQGLRTLNQRRALEAALTNERLTRDRVAALKRQLAAADKEAHLLRVAFMGFVSRGFWSRLGWLLLGK